MLKKFQKVRFCFKHSGLIGFVYDNDSLIFIFIYWPVFDFVFILDFKAWISLLFKFHRRQSILLQLMKIERLLKRQRKFLTYQTPTILLIFLYYLFILLLAPPLLLLINRHHQLLPLRTGWFLVEKLPAVDETAWGWVVSS